MKRCPECRRDYHDETLLYCLDDGAHLLDGPASAGSNEPSTAILHETAPPQEAATRQQIHTTDAATGSTFGSAPARSMKALIAIAATIFVLGGGFFAYKYFGPFNRGHIGSIAVLPFTNVGGDPAFEYVSDGLAEALINHLSRLPGMKVIARSSSFTFKGKEVDLQEAAKQLGVDAIVTGRVQQRGDDITIALEMVNATDRTQMWGETYNRKVAEIRTLQTEIARTVSEKLRNRLTGEQEKQLAKGETTNAQAYELFLKGRYFSGRANFQKAVECLEQAVAIDPFYANAHAALSVSYANMAAFGSNTDRRTFIQKRISAAEKAVEIAPDSDQVQRAVGVWKIYEYRFAEAETAFRRAIEINPNYSAAYTNLAVLYMWLKRHDEAISLSKHSIELDPLMAITRMNHVEHLAFSGRYDDAVKEAAQGIALAPENPLMYIYRAEAYEGKKMFIEAIVDVQKACEIEKENIDFRVILAATYARSGDRARAMVILKENEGQFDKTLPAYLAGLYAALGDNQKALDLLEKGFREGDPILLQIAVDPAFDTLRNEPRFKELLRKLNLPE